MQVLIEDIVEAMEWSSHDSFLNVETGEIITIDEEYEYALRQFEQLPENAGDRELYEAFGWRWEAPEFLNFLRHEEQYRRLPTRYEIHEYKIMESFVITIEDDDQRETLWMAIRGSGAFRRFKDTIHRYGIQRDWYDFKERRLTKMAQQWCFDNGIPYASRQSRSK